MMTKAAKATTLPARHSQTHGAQPTASMIP
jgi:hypothetical protein